MKITREQVDAVKDALGLDKNLTHSITVTPSHVHVQSVALIDGLPDVRDGMLGIDAATYEIEEAPRDGNDA